MTFLPITPYDDLKPEARAARDRQAERQGEDIDTFQATLLGNVPSFNAYMALHTLREEIAPWIGERAVTLFAYAISDENGCRNDSAHFGRIASEAGDDPDRPQVTETEQLLIDWGRLIVRSPHEIPAQFYDRLEAAFSPERRLTLLAFAGQMVATNLLNTVGRIPSGDVSGEKSGDKSGDRSGYTTAAGEK